MDDSSSTPASWSFHEPVAQLHGGALAGFVDISHPELGLNRLALDGRSLGGSMLCVRRPDESIDGKRQVSRPWPVADAYVRGADLVATYRPTDDWPFSPQIYWRAHLSDHPQLHGSLSLLVSVQTNLLETWPHISVESCLQAEEVLLLAPHSSKEVDANSLSRGDHVISPSTSVGCILQRFTGEQFSYVEIMPASDFRELRVRWAPDGSCRTNWSLFADFLEKGVIWRARLQTLIVPRRDDVALAMSCCRAIDERPLPLTT